jgi:tripartite-type tricarboxylate transporter receptor subunit TctC
MRSIVVRFSFAIVASICAAAAPAAEYPTRPIRLIVPFAPGGGTDLLARLIAPRLAEVLGQQVVVDNRGGAGSVVGTEILAKAPADGYTLGFMDSAFAINPAILASLPYNPEKDFAFLNIVATSPTVLIVRATLAAKTLPELIAFAKSNPGKLTFGSAGSNSSGHLTGEMFNAAASVKITHVAFKGAGAALVDLLGGHIDVAYVTPSSIVSHVQTGAVRALAITGAKRAATLPNVPTFDSLGLRSVNPGNFRFLVGPAALSRPIQTRLATAMDKLARMPDLAARLAENGYDPTFLGPPAAREYLVGEFAKWRKVVQQPGMKGE